MNFADTNWLSALYLPSNELDEESKSRRALVHRFMRKHGGRLLISPIVLLEARNVFSRVTGESKPAEWALLESDFDGRLYIDPINWRELQRGCEGVFSRYSHKATIGTFDAAIVTSAKLAGARTFLSFDKTAKAMAVAEGLETFPELDRDAKKIFNRLRA
jgi:predicted nucleic acid-binding protein